MLGGFETGRTTLITDKLPVESDEHFDFFEFSLVPFQICQQDVRLQIWDIAQSNPVALDEVVKHPAIKRIFYKGTNCIFVIIDLTRPDTLEEARSWLNHFKQNSSSEIGNIPIAVIGNKVDIARENITDSIPEDKVEEFLSEIEMQYSKAVGYLESSIADKIDLQDISSESETSLYSRLTRFLSDWYCKG